MADLFRFKATSLAGKASMSFWRACAYFKMFDNWDYPRRDVYMRRTLRSCVSVVAGKSTELNTFMHI
jgi:hypothetical protein